jgi:hypothetical protein
MHSLQTCCSSRARGLTAIVALGLISSACALTGIDPDEIDIADGDEVGQDESGQDETSTEPSLDDSAGEAGTGETGENDQDTTGDTSDSGSSTTSAEDTGALSCEATDELALGDNAVEAAMAESLFEGECGGSGGESIYSFTASAAGDHSFAITSGDIPAIIYALDTQCSTIAGACAVDASGFVLPLMADETVFIVVDTDGGGGAATLTITGP